jgi:hypothetical protein
VNDVSRANSQLGAFSVRHYFFTPTDTDNEQDFIRTWTLAPFGRSAVTTVRFLYNNDSVYFAQANSPEFHGELGVGTFELNGTTTTDPEHPLQSNENLAGKSKGSTGNLLRWVHLILPLVGCYTPSTIRFPQWGIRIHCKKLEDPQINL